MTIFITRIKYFSATALIVLLSLGTTENMQAQRLKHPVSRGGNTSMAHRPATRPASRPTTANRKITPPTNRGGSINGGHKKVVSRNNLPNNKSVTTRNKPTINNNNKQVINRNKPTINNNKGKQVINRNKNTSNVKTINRRPGNTGGGRNNININNSHNNININVNNNRHNHRNTYVRHSHRHYSRPPYIFGGFRFYCHWPYYYHPYRPYYWGPHWHPWGYFVTSLATTAIIVSIIDHSNDNNEEYHYDNGTYYLKTEDGFEAVQAPIGAQVPSIPNEAEKVTVNETNNYYYGGAFYEQNADGYIVVPATAGTIVPNLPEGGEEVKIGDQTYVQFGETYYQPIQVDGKNMYEIVDVLDDE